MSAVIVKLPFPVPDVGMKDNQVAESRLITFQLVLEVTVTTTLRPSIAPSVVVDKFAGLVVRVSATKS